MKRWRWSGGEDESSRDLRGYGGTAVCNNQLGEQDGTLARRATGRRVHSERGPGGSTHKDFVAVQHVLANNEGPAQAALHRSSTTRLGQQQQQQHPGAGWPGQTAVSSAGNTDRITSSVTRPPPLRIISASPNLRPRKCSGKSLNRCMCCREPGGARKEHARAAALPKSGPKAAVS